MRSMKPKHRTYGTQPARIHALTDGHDWPNNKRDDNYNVSDVNPKEIVGLRANGVPGVFSVANDLEVDKP
jgi:hypothetical protein